MLIYIALLVWGVLITGIILAYRSFLTSLKFKPVKKSYYYYYKIKK